jgi:hypothetical protein
MGTVAVVFCRQTKTRVSVAHLLYISSVAQVPSLVTDTTSHGAVTSVPKLALSPLPDLTILSRWATGPRVGLRAPHGTSAFRNMSLQRISYQDWIR